MRIKINTKGTELHNKNCSTATKRKFYSHKYAMLRNWKVNINVSSSQNDLYRFGVNQTELSEAIREVDFVLYMEMQRT